VSTTELEKLRSGDYKAPGGKLVRVMMKHCLIGKRIGGRDFEVLD